jgi:hypothetical protein
VLRFGKHRGERFDAVPIDYLKWIVEGPNELSGDVRWLARLARSASREWSSR